jgi:hypothetical protein
MLLVLLGCFVLKSTQKPEQEIIKTQEEYQMELLEMLDKISLLFYKDDPFSEELPRKEIAPGVEIFSDKLATYIYCYVLAGNNDSVATLEDIASLYTSYDEELEKKFLNLYYWLKLQNGRSFYTSYCLATRTACALYEKQYGSINSSETSIILIEERIMLEQFARDNPDFMPGEVYYKELRNMRIISGDEYYAFKEAAQE